MEIPYMQNLTQNLPDKTHKATGKRPKIEVKNLTKKFDELLVLDNISFDVKDGDFLAIVGPTGCGKTTFLNTLSKLLPATNGNILIDGVEANPQKHNLAFVFQEPTCMPWRTVRENVAYGMEIKKFSKAEIDQKLNQILDLIGLTDCSDLYPNQVSASMEQRIAVARAFSVSPDLMLMDEPYGQLDIKLRYHLEDELVRLWQTLKSTVLFITHNIEEAVYVAEKVLILSEKPTTVKRVIDIDLPRPRDILSPKFIELRELITEEIRWW